MLIHPFMLFILMSFKLCIVLRETLLSLSLSPLSLTLTLCIQFRPKCFLPIVAATNSQVNQATVTLAILSN